MLYLNYNCLFVVKFCVQILTVIFVLYRPDDGVLNVTESLLNINIEDSCNGVFFHTNSSSSSSSRSSSSSSCIKL